MSKLITKRKVYCLHNYFLNYMKPVIVATWKFGIKSTIVGMKILRAQGSAVDAVEEAVKQSRTN